MCITSKVKSSLSLLLVCFFINMGFLCANAQGYDEAGEVSIIALNSVTEGVEKTERAITQIEVGLDRARKFLNTSEGKAISKGQRVKILQQIAEAEYALN